MSINEVKEYKRIAKEKHLDYMKMQKELLKLNKIHGVTVTVITKGV